MKLKLASTEEALDVVKRMVFLAYCAAGGATGMGIFQAIRLGSGSPDEERVWKCAYNSEDYGGRRSSSNENEVYCDYVFGSMIKWGCTWDNKTINIPEKTFRPDYQAFCKTYKDNKALITAALESLEIKTYNLDGVRYN